MFLVAILQKLNSHIAYSVHHVSLNPLSFNDYYFTQS